MNILKKILFLLIISQIILANDMGTEWADNGTMLRYPSSKYFYGVGISNKSSDDAKSNAISTVLNQIIVEVKSYQYADEYSLISDKESKESSSYESKVRLRSGGDLTGVKIIATTNKNGNYYAFGALDKKLFRENSLAKIKELHQIISKSFTDAKKYSDSSKVNETLRSLSISKKSIKRLNLEREMLSSIEPLSKETASPISIVDIDKLYSTLLNSINIKKISGDNQEFFITELPEYFSILVTADNKPAEGLCLEIKNSDGKVVAKSISNNEGEVVFILADRAETTKGEHVYSVSPSLKVTNNREIIEKLTVSFKYIVKSSPNYVNIVYKTSEKDLESDTSKVFSAIKSLLKGYDILHDSWSSKTLEVSISKNDKEDIEGISEKRTFIREEVLAKFTLKTDNDVEITSFDKKSIGVGSNIISSVSKGISLLKIKGDIKIIKDSLPKKPSKENAGTEHKIIILPFKNSNYISDWYGLSRTITAMITTSLTGITNFSVLERDQVDKLVDELNFTEEIVDYSKFGTAGYAVLGNAFMKNGIIEIDARIVDIKTSKIISTTSITGSSINQLRKMANLISVNLQKEIKKLK